MGKAAKYIRKIKHLFCVPIFYQIGSYKLKLPASHTLPVFKSQFKRYDEPLAEVANWLGRNMPDKVIVDVGANVGDTAAYIRSHCENTILAIEAHPSFLPYLQENASQLPNVIIADTYLSDNSKEAIKVNQTSGGTASIAKAGSNITTIGSVSTLSEVLLDKKITSKQLGLIKSDTDGYDFKILLSAFSTISEANAIIYFEYDLSFYTTASDDGLALVHQFFQAGYELIIYDNFGNPLGSATTYEIFLQLHNYLKITLSNGGGVYYFDVLAFPAALSLGEELRKLYNQKASRD